MTVLLKQHSKTCKTAMVCTSGFVDAVMCPGDGLKYAMRKTCILKLTHQRVAPNSAESVTENRNRYRDILKTKTDTDVGIEKPKKPKTDEKNTEKPKIRFLLMTIQLHIQQLCINVFIISIWYLRYI